MMIDGKLPTRGLVYAALFGAMTAAGALIVIPLPPVPVTAQTFFMNVAALLLGGPLAVVSQIIYVLMGVMGMPVFAGGKAGLGILFGPTGGYLFGFIIAAFVIGHVHRMKKNAGAVWQIFSMVLGMLVIYVAGSIQLAWIAKMNIPQALIVGVVPFIPGDLIKIALAVLISSRLKNRIKI